MFVNKLLDNLLIVKSKKIKLLIVENSITENPVPILWNYQGIYGWIPVEIVKNEIQNWENIHRRFHPDEKSNRSCLEFNWQQAHRLRPDVGKMLEELVNAC